MKQVAEMLISNELSLDVKNLAQPGVVNKSIECRSRSGSSIDIIQDRNHLRIQIKRKNSGFIRNKMKKID